MRKQNRSCSALATAKNKYHFGANMLQNTKDKDKYNKRGDSAEGCSLLTSALRPRLFGAGIIVGAIAITGTILGVNNNSVSAVQATLTIPDSISAEVNPYANGGFAEGTAGQVDVSTSNQAGYTLSIKAKDGTELKNGNSVLNSIDTNLTVDQYKNGEYYNTWGFKPDVVNSLANSNYIPSPSTSGIVLAKSNTNSLAPESFNLAIATKVNQNAVAGNYTNSFVLTATGNEARYNIKFDNNGGTGGPQTPQTDLIGDNLEVQINSETPSMSGKDFLGWCTKKPKEDGSCTGVMVQPAGCFPLCKCDLDITLYAMYGAKSSGSIGGITGDGTDGTPCSTSGRYGFWYGGLCWMDSDLQEDSTSELSLGTAKALCVGKWRLSTKDDFQKLLNSVGAGNQLYNLGWSGGYWSSTPGNYSHDVWYLSVSSSSATIISNGLNASTNHFKARCVAG